MDELLKILEAMKSARQRWCADVVDDPEDMFLEYPEFLNWAIPSLEKYIMNITDAPTSLMQRGDKQ
jgi:hypothetical protein